jgi:hypothetical protein
VLLPGAGLGRLCVEVAAAGWEAQGNEFSYFMLLSAAFMLNATVRAQQWTVHPWLHMTCNNVSDADQLRGVAVPDMVPGHVVPPGMLSMCAGDFAVSACAARPRRSGVGSGCGCWRPALRAAGGARVLVLVLPPCTHHARHTPRAATAGGVCAPRVPRLVRRGRHVLLHRHSAQHPRIPGGHPQRAAPWGLVGAPRPAAVALG